IQKGTVTIRKRKGSSYVEIGRLYSGEVLGELSFFDRMPRSAAAMALTEVEALEISFESMDRIYSAVPNYMKTIVTAMANRLRKADEMIRKLQKEVVNEAGQATEESAELSASEIFAATTEGGTGSSGETPGG